MWVRKSIAARDRRSGRARMKASMEWCAEPLRWAVVVSVVLGYVAAAIIGRGVRPHAARRFSGSGISLRGLVKGE